MPFAFERERGRERERERERERDCFQDGILQQVDSRTNWLWAKAGSLSRGSALKTNTVANARVISLCFRPQSYRL